MFTRRGYDWSDCFHHIVAAAGELVTHGAVLDGEVIVPTSDGRSDLRRSKERSRGKPVQTTWCSTPSISSTLKGSIYAAVRWWIVSVFCTRSLEGVKGPIKYTEHRCAGGA
jgi:hypothetical protein